MGKSLKVQALARLGKDWSVASQTREARLQGVSRFADFVQRTFGLERIDNLKPRHVEAYARSLYDDGISARTGANYLAHVRDICNAIGKGNIVARDNASYGFGQVSRQNPLTENVGKVMEIRAVLQIWADLGDREAKMMVATAAMREAFGCRQKEAMMSTRVVQIDGKPHLLIEGAKGGLERHVPIRNEGQMAALRLSREMAAHLGNANGRPIPPEMPLKTAMRHESKAWHGMGGTRSEQANMHAARHTYAQTRLAEGATREEVNRELGHGEQRSLGSYAK